MDRVELFSAQVQLRSAARPADQSRLLTVGDRVCWNADNDDQSTLTEKNWAGVTIKWDSRSERVILHNDMAQVEWVPYAGLGRSPRFGFAGLDGLSTMPTRGRSF
jgi:hypothetical protein